MDDALDFALDEFGKDSDGCRLFLVIAGKKVPVVQNTLPKEATGIDAGYALFGAGDVMCRKKDIFEATGGVLPKLESQVSLIVEGQSSGDTFQIDQVETSHGDPGISITLKSVD